MTPEEKLELDLADCWKIIGGLETYSCLDTTAVMERLKEHKEDAFCQLTDYSGNGRLFCTRDGYDAILDLAERHRDSMSVPDDYSARELAEGIIRHFVRAVVDEKYDEPALARVLLEAVKDAEKNHVERTYHFPCVVVAQEVPPQFKIGPVIFTSAKAFPQVFARELTEYVEASLEPTHARDRISRFQEYLSHLGWLASVAVPRCAEESAQHRAEVGVATAINLLRLLMGVPHGRGMRLVHSVHSRPVETEHAVSVEGKLHFVWSRQAGGALVEDDWHLVMHRRQDFWNRAAHLLSTAIAGKRSEIAERVIDALTWFGEAGFESAPGTQIFDFVAALERLTTTESFSAHRFCSRVALLAFEDESTFEKTYWDAYAIHTARSSVVHGTFSPSSPGFLKSVRLAHDVTRNALFRGLEIHCLLDDEGKMSNLSDLRNFFVGQLSKRAAVLTRLGQELKEKKAIARGGHKS